MKSFNWVNNNILYRFDPDHSFFKQALRTTLATSVAILVRYVILPPNISQSYWIIITASVLSHSRIGVTQNKQILSLIIAVISSSTLCYIMLLFNNVWLLGLLLAVICAVAIIAMIINSKLISLTKSVAIMVIISSGLTVENSQIAFQRFETMLLGGTILVLTALLWPTSLSHTWFRLQKVYFLSLSDLAKQFMNIYTLNNYDIKRQKYEKLFRERKFRILVILKSLNNIANYNKKKKTFNHDKLNFALQTYEILMIGLVSIGNLRHDLTKNQLSKHNEIRIIVAEIYKKFNILIFFKAHNESIIKQSIIQLELKNSIKYLNHISQSTSPQMLSSLISFSNTCYQLSQYLSKSHIY